MSLSQRIGLGLVAVGAGVALVVTGGSAASPDPTAVNAEHVAEGRRGGTVAWISAGLPDAGYVAVPVWAGAHAAPDGAMGADGIEVQCRPVGGGPVRWCRVASGLVLSPESP